MPITRTAEQPRRIIEAAMIESIGPVNARELINMPPDDWGIIRDRITDYANGKPDGLLARCMMCEGRVFIQTRMKGGKKLPYFAHYKGGDPNCKWFSGKTIPPDVARADQYQGNQESPAHRMLCAQIEELVRLDPRYLKSAIGQYHSPTKGTHGRYPDVYVEWRGLQPFAIEVQLSNTFQTEVSSRGVYYEREGVNLVWVLYGLDLNEDDVPQSFHDVIRRHRGNAFMIDRAAVEASKTEKTLVLSCYLKNAGEHFDGPFLVRIDELTKPRSSLAYYDDRLTAGLRRRIDERRKPWFEVLEPLRNSRLGEAVQSEQVAAVLNLLKSHVEPLSQFGESQRDDRLRILRLIAIVFSIVSSANGHDRNYASRHLNIKAMLNTFLNAESSVQMYALIIERLLRSTALNHLLGGTVGTHVERAKRAVEGNLCLEGDPEWRIMTYLVPEIFDARIRAELIYLDSLPAWASPRLQ